MIAWAGTPITTPTAPSTLDAVGAIDSNTLTWTAPSDGGSPITNYQIYRSTASPAGGTPLATVGTVLNYTDNTATPGTQYFYRIKATNAIGDSNYSNEDFATPIDSCPSGPSGGNVTGWAWSETIGWISLNGADTDTCTTQTYGLNISGGTVTGYAWSENIGWIQFGGLSGFPTGGGTTPSNATVVGSNVVGWARATSYSDAQAGWDGWIALSGTDYGLTITGNALLGWAWGDTNLGWIDFSAGYACGATYGYYCTANDRHHRDLSCNIDTVGGVPETCSYLCTSGACVPPPNPTGTLSGGKALTVAPSFIRPGQTVTVTWGTQDTTSCTVTENNAAITDSWTGLNGTQTSSPISTNTTYTLSCTGGGGTSLNATAKVTVAPKWREF
jgi:hypothetical protein